VQWTAKSTPPLTSPLWHREYMRNIILETERLKLEKIGEDHFGNLYKLLSNEKVHKYFPKALDEIESNEFYEKILSRYKTDGYCFWAVIRKNDNEFLGICGILNQKIDGQVESEIGYRLLETFWCNGYGTEAAKGCIDYAEDKLSEKSVISLIRSVNIPSIRVAEKNGFQFEKETIFHELPHRVYRLKLA
jgi:[ribosomal protein S5]-alanine N-acetyltransferase